MDRVFRHALLVALGVHVAASALVVRAREPAELAGRAGTPETTREGEAPVEVAIDPVEPAATSEPVAGAVPAGLVAPTPSIAVAIAPRPAPAPRTVDEASSLAGSAPPSSLTSPDGAPTAGVAPSSSSAPFDPLATFAPGPARPSWMPAPLGAGAKLAEAPAAAPSPDAQLASKVSHDVTALVDARPAGAQFAGPAVTVAHDAAMSPSAPDVGTALFVVRTDSSGAVTSVSLADVSGDLPGWSALGARIQAALASQRLTVPAGANGVAVSLKVTARYALPSGASKAIDPFVGGKAGIGAGFDFDLGDLGQKKSRVVAVTVTAESRL